MKILGITNLVVPNNKDLGVFMWEFDKVAYEYILEECNFLVKCFDFDLYLLESSKDSFHLISFDIMTKNEISQIQAFSSIDTDYLNIDELACNFYNILRLGNKGSKKSPKFIKVFYAQNNRRLKSLGHYKVYYNLCYIPEIPKDRAKYLIKTNIDLIMYNSNKCNKGVLKKKWI